jgi:hypothetical protein
VPKPNSQVIKSNPIKVDLTQPIASNRVDDPSLILGRKKTLARHSLQMMSSEHRDKPTLEYNNNVKTMFDDIERRYEVPDRMLINTWSEETQGNRINRVNAMLDDIERRYDVRILYAVECAENEWQALDSSPPTNTYIIRFVYVRNSAFSYLSLGTDTEVRETRSFDRSASYKRPWSYEQKNYRAMVFYTRHYGTCHFAETF